MQRDEKGRFIKGGKPPKNSPLCNGLASEMQARSVEARLANKHGQELVRAMLEGRVLDPVVIDALKKAGYDIAQVSNEVALHARQIEKAQKTGDTKAYSALMKAAGYDTLNINTNGPQVVVVSQQAIQAANKWSKKKAEQ